MLSEKEFESLCRLARLEPTDPSLRGLLDDFNQILKYVEHIREIDVQELGEYYTALDAHNVMRPDEPGGVLPPDAVRRIAPQWEAGHFVVPRVIE